MLQILRRVESQRKLRGRWIRYNSLNGGSELYVVGAVVKQILAEPLVEVEPIRRGHGGRILSGLVVVQTARRGRSASVFTEGRRRKEAAHW